MNGCKHLRNLRPAQSRRFLRRFRGACPACEKQHAKQQKQNRRLPCPGFLQPLLQILRHEYCRRERCHGRRGHSAPDPFVIIKPGLIQHQKHCRHRQNHRRRRNRRIEQKGGLPELLPVIEQIAQSDQPDTRKLPRRRHVTPAQPGIFQKLRHSKASFPGRSWPQIS